jgi:hypothetical protein
VFPCLAASQRKDGNPYSEEMKTALLALVADKRCEPVLGSRTHSQEVLKGFAGSQQYQFMQAETRADLVRVVGGIDLGASSPWYKNWRELFSLLPEGNRLDERHIMEMTSEDSVIGWAAANVVRRFRDKLDDAGRRQLRTMYAAAASDDQRCEVIRWRAVHAMGVFPDPQNVALLQSALADDPYHWVRFGAARALTELAARYAEKDVAKKMILPFLEQRCGDLPPRIQAEIGQVVFYREAPECWVNDASPLLKGIVESQRGEAAKRTWQERLERFQAREWQI